MQPLLAIKLKNQILAIDPNLDVKLKNVTVNGVKFGCSGFITDGAGKVVYVDTDHNHHTVTKALYRSAKDTKDYTGGPNNFVSYDGLAEAAVKLLKSGR